MSLTYRREIDGLRAVAILSVVLYHADLPLITGGYVGVDVFFVISGFLITSIIVTERDKGTFSLSGFWERRARRILPPLVAMVLVTVAASWFLLLPVDYALLGEQVAVQSVFSSNILFWRQAGYFDTENDLKPLLHTWSLAAEEQFYVLFPLALLALWKLRAPSMMRLLLAAALGSLLISAIKAMDHSWSAFYLLPFRAWELMLGVLLALRTPEIPSVLRAEAIGIAGLGAIFIACVAYTSDTPFPGLAALLPCLGAAAVIWSTSQHDTMTKRVLSFRPLVLVGLVSYGWYLWHWPVLALGKYASFSELSQAAKIACLAISLALAVISWHLVEGPVRRRTLLATRRSVFVAAAASLVALGLIGVGLKFTDGLPHRLSDEAAAFMRGATDINPHRTECDRPDLHAIESGAVCRTFGDRSHPARFVLWGDSQADAMAPLFFALSERYKVGGAVVTGHGCPPILDIERREADYDCAAYNRAVIDLIRRENVKHVFVIGFWSGWMARFDAGQISFRNLDWYPRYEAAFESVLIAGLRRTVDELLAQGVTVYVVKDIPKAGFDPPRTLARIAMYGARNVDDTIPFEPYASNRRIGIDALAAATASPRVVFVDPAEKLCHAGQCKVSDSGRSLYQNPSHLSAYGALYLADLFSPHLEPLRP